MLSIGAMAGGQGNYYTNLAREDYYVAGGEPLGRWRGEGPKKLGLPEIVRREHLRALLDGFDQHGNPLIQNAGKRGKGGHQPGWDLTFSVPKSVSVLWSQAPEWLRRIIQDAHQGAVQAGLSYLQDEAAYSRRGKGGQTVERCGLIVATFEHGTSRALDPDLHTHCLVMNVATRSDNTTGTILSRPLYQHKMTAGALYRAELAAFLERTLGVECVLDKTSFRIEGVPQNLCDHFSTRRAEINERLRAKGLSSAAAADVAALDTRKRKDEVPPRAELFETWRPVGSRFGFDPTSVLRRMNVRITPEEWHAKTVVTQGLRELTQSDSHFTRRRLLQTVAVAAQERGLDAGQVRAAVTEALASSRRIVRLGRIGGEDRYTTKATMKFEQNLIRSASVLSERRQHGASAGIVEKVIARHSAPRSAVVGEVRHHAEQLGKALRKEKTEPVSRGRVRAQAKATLSDEQKAAVRYLTRNGGGSIRALEGWAGTGKTTTLRAAAETWRRAGYEVIGVTVAGKARKELQEGAGIKSYTYAMLDVMTRPSMKYRARHHAKQLWRAARGKPTFALKPFRLPKKSVLVIDEAGMMGNRQLARLLRDVEKRGGMVALVGDRKQLAAIEAGGGFAYVADHFGRAELTTIVRQRDEKDRQSVKDIATGNAKAALKSLAERGRVTVADDREKAVTALVSDWAKHEKGRAHESLIFVGTREEAHDLNTRCQRERLKGKELDSGEHVAVTAEGVTDAKSKEKVTFDLYRGDRVLFTRISRSLGVENGDTGTVTKVTKRPWPIGSTVTVKLDSGATVLIPLKSYDGIRLGYAVTTHKGQGTTVERAYLLAGGRMTNKELSYVQASRARDTTRVYADKHEAGPELTRLAKQMTESREKLLAHAVQQRSEQEERVRQLEDEARRRTQESQQTHTR